MSGGGVCVFLVDDGEGLVIQRKLQRFKSLLFLLRRLVVAKKVETAEAVEVLAINCLAPFVLNGHLRKHMERSPFKDRHIVNVSAMEGAFILY